MRWKVTEYPVISVHAPLSLAAAIAVFNKGRAVTDSSGRIWAIENAEDIYGPEPFWISRSAPLTHHQAEAVGREGAILRTSFGAAGWFLFRYWEDVWYSKRMSPSVVVWEGNPGGPEAYGPCKSWFVAYPTPEIVGESFLVSVSSEDLEDV